MRKKAEIESIETGTRPELIATEDGRPGDGPVDDAVDRPLDIRSSNSGVETDSERRHRIYLDLRERDERERERRNPANHPGSNR